MRNTKHKLFHHKTLKRLRNELNICDVARDYCLALAMQYYRRYGKGLSYANMSKPLTKLKQLETYKHSHDIVEASSFRAGSIAYKLNRPDGKEFQFNRRGQFIEGQLSDTLSCVRNRSSLNLHT